MSIIHGLKPNKNITPLLFDEFGNILVSAVNLTSSGEKLSTDSDGKLFVIPVLGAYVSPMAVSARYENLNLAAGTNSGLVITPVSTSQVWEVNVVGMRYIGTVAGVIMNMFIDKGGVLSNIFTVQPPVTNKYEFAYLSVVMDAGDILKVTITGATLNDDFVGVMSGRRIL